MREQPILSRHQERRPHLFPRRIALRLALACLAGSEALAQYGSSADPYDWIFLIPDPISDLSRREMIASAAGWSDHLHLSGLGWFRANFLDTLTEVDAFIKKRRAEGKPPTFAIIDGLVCQKKAWDWDVTPMLCPTYKGSTTTHRVVVVSRSHPARSVKDLAGQRFAVAKMWAEAPDLLGLALFGEAIDPRGFFKELVPLPSQSDCLVAVARRQADAALVVGPFLDAVQKHNRQAWSEFRIVETMSEYHLAPIVFFNDTPKELIEALRMLTLNARESDAGRHILDLYNVDAFQLCGPDTLREPEARMVARLAAAREGARAPAKEAAPSRGTEAMAPEPAAAGPALREPGAEAKDVKIESLDVERDADTGEVSAIVKFGGAPPSSLKALVAFDEGPEQSYPLDCTANVCVLALPADRVKGKRRLSLLLVVEREGKTVRLGARKSYPLTG